MGSVAISFLYFLWWDLFKYCTKPLRTVHAIKNIIFMTQPRVRETLMDLNGRGSKQMHWLWYSLCCYLLRYKMTNMIQNYIRLTENIGV